ncbi:hypothetical protein SLA2020_382180 [Shorea laevis]
MTYKGGSATALFDKPGGVFGYGYGVRVGRIQNEQLWACEMAWFCLEAQLEYADLLYSFARAKAQYRLDRGINMPIGARDM